MCVRTLVYFKNTKEQFRDHEIRACNFMAYDGSYLSGSGPYGH
ncbi:hypothetical protein Ark11_0906 [Candidatus Ichthyocystis hellenicum]|uniref:Uncharacterized protein n=1 Tax=Candidatus Ichthyocystis hellenicum TaxID=1561003 RepID=A0A0S4M3C4_9BURK|nr:hypothetical protein [Candidatus Ichthyocystis hellenicum]CUT17728.1 hypothetical protein Ark11_0906 [Candidatus Ichthyocystis hellenicum]